MRNHSVLAALIIAALLNPGAARAIPPGGAATVMWTVRTPPPAGYEISSRPAKASYASCRRTPRAEADRTDVIRGPQVHVVYLVAADERDRRFDQRGIIDCSVRAFNRWFEKGSQGFTWRIDTFRWKGRVLTDVTFLKSTLDGDELQDPSVVDEELRRQGLDHPDKTYLTYVEADAGSLCGSASYPVIGQHGRRAAVYLRGDPGCRGDEFGIPGKPLWVEATALHELAHAEGAVPIGAPRGCAVLDLVPTHVCTPGVVLTEPAGVQLDPERIDLMFPFVTEPLSDLVLDRDNDDYFAHPFPYRDLKDSPFLQSRD